MCNIDIRYNIGDKLITNDERIVTIKAIHVYISGMTIGYQFYVTDIKSRKSKYISESNIYDFFESMEV